MITRIKTLRNILIILTLFILKGCIVPPAPRHDYYKLIELSDDESFYDGIGYVYKNDKYIFNLWVFSTSWKHIFLSTNYPIKDSISIKINRNKVIYLKKMNNDSIDKFPYSLYHNDSINVYSKKIKIDKNSLYTKKNNDTIMLRLGNKNYTFHHIDLKY